jgi:hypothetical protein
MPKSRTFYCSVISFLDAKYSSYAEAIRDLCVDRELLPRRHGYGLTFVIPKDKKIIDNIVKAVDSDNSSDLTNATRFVRSCIIPIKIDDGSNFLNRPIGNKLTKLKVSDASANKMSISPDVVITKATDFQAQEGHEIAIWYLESGTIPTEGDHFMVPMQPKPDKARKVKGGFEDSTSVSDSTHVMRSQIYERIQQYFVYALCCKQANMYKKCTPVNTYVSILNQMNSDDRAVFIRALPFSALASMYICIQPEKTTGTYVVPDSIINRIGDSYEGTTKLPEFDQLMNYTPDGSSLAEKPSEYANVVKQVRDCLHECAITELPGKIIEIYTTLIN